MIVSKTTLSWYLVVCVSAMIFTWGYLAGHVEDIVKTDITHISVFIALLYLGTTLHLGWALHTGRTPNRVWLNFLDERMVTLGLLGTVVGMLLTMQLFWSGRNIELAEAFAVIGAGSAVALYTTVVGLICSELLKLQLRVTGYLDE